MAAAAPGSPRAARPPRRPPGAPRGRRPARSLAPAATPPRPAAGRPRAHWPPPRPRPAPRPASSALIGPRRDPAPPRSRPPARSLAPAATPRRRAPGAPRGRRRVPGRVGRRAAALEAAEAAVRPDALGDEDEEEALPHSEAVDVFQEGLAMVVQDPLLCDLPIQVTLEEVSSQIALEYGQAMTVRVCKVDGEVMPVVVVQNATVLDLKKAIQRHVQLKQEREGGAQHISWSYVWRTYHLTSAGEKLTDDRKRLRDYGIRNRDEVSFVKKLRQK